MKITTMKDVRNTDLKVEEMSVSEFFEKLNKPKIGPKGSAGAYITGECYLEKGCRKTKSREAVVIDVDHPENIKTSSLFEGIKRYEYLTHTTASATAKNKRLRLIFPLSKPITNPEKFRALSNALMFLIHAPDVRHIKELRVLDWSAAEFNRIMFFGSVSHPHGFFEAQHHAGELIDFDSFFEANRDLEEMWSEIKSPEEFALKYKMPVIIDKYRNSKPAVEVFGRRKTSTFDSDSVSYGSYDVIADRGDPRDFDSIVGSFCKIFNIKEAIDYFDLPYSSSGNRIKYEPSHSPPGCLIDDSGQWFLSKHETDPACTGHFENAYDLVRLHKFPTSEFSDYESKRKMWSLAFDIPAVKEIEKPRFFKHKNKNKN